MSDEPLSVNDAVALLDAAPAEPETDETPEAAQDARAEGEETEAQPSAEDADAPEEASEGEDEADEGEAQPALDKPRSWAAEDDETWAGIPRAAQEKILARETERDQATDRALQQAADARRTADAEVQKAVAIHSSLTEALPQAQRVFQNKWSNWTPENQAQLAREKPAEYTALKAQHEAEQSNLAKFETLHKEAEQIAFAEFVRGEQAKLPALAPDLADPKEGPARRQALATFLHTVGFSDENISRADANMIAIAYDAMRFRQGQSRITTPKPAPAAKVVKPTSAPERSTPQRAAQEAKNRFAQTRSVEDAVRWLDSKG